VSNGVLRAVFSACVVCHSHMPLKPRLHRIHVARIRTSNLYPLVSLVAVYVYPLPETNLSSRRHVSTCIRIQVARPGWRLHVSGVNAASVAYGCGRRRRHWKPLVAHHSTQCWLAVTIMFGTVFWRAFSIAILLRFRLKFPKSTCLKYKKRVFEFRKSRSMLSPAHTKHTERLLNTARRRTTSARSMKIHSCRTWLMWTHNT